MRIFTFLLFVCLGFVGWMVSRDEPEHGVKPSESSVLANGNSKEARQAMPISKVDESRSKSEIRSNTRLVDPPKQVEAAGMRRFMDLDDHLRGVHEYRDEQFGVSLEYPQGWSVKSAIRWGENGEKSTVFFQPAEGSEAVPSMFYQEFVDTPPDPRYAEAVMREQARQKQIARLESGMVDYKNDAESFEYKEVDGKPSLSYFATYSKGDDVHAEYFMRVIGETGYVMFFVRGPVDDVSEAIPPVNEMGLTVTPP